MRKCALWTYFYSNVYLRTSRQRTWGVNLECSDRNICPWLVSSGVCGEGHTVPVLFTVVTPNPFVLVKNNSMNDWVVCPDCAHGNLPFQASGQRKFEVGGSEHEWNFGSIYVNQGPSFIYSRDPLGAGFYARCEIQHWTKLTKSLFSWRWHSKGEPGCKQVSREKF